MLAVEPRGLGGTDEELGSVGVPSGVGHSCKSSAVDRTANLSNGRIGPTEDTATSVLQLEVLIGELFNQHPICNTH